MKRVTEPELMIAPEQVKAYVEADFSSTEEDMANQLFEILRKYDYSLIFNENRQGQIKSVDYAYSMVETPYIFHLEDDWEFYESYFIEHSFKLMDEDSKLITVWLRELNDTMDHPVGKEYKFATYLEENQPLFVLKFFYLEDFKSIKFKKSI